MRHILYIWDSDYPWDVRVEKICGSLKRAGHDVHIVARNLRGQKVYEQIDGLNIHRLRVWGNGPLNYAVSFPAFFNPLWKYFLDEIITRVGIDLVIVRDLPMALAGIWAGRRHRIPVVFDMAEDYVALIRDIWHVRKFQGLNLVVRNPYFAKWVERRVLRQADHILVVVEEARELVLKNGGKSEKVSIVGNTPPLETFDRPLKAADEVQEMMTAHYTALYVGGIQMGRGIQTVLEAIPLIIEKIPHFLFVVVGDGYARERLMRQAVTLGVQDYVLWAGWVDHDRIYDYIDKCKVGIIPHLVSDHVNTTMPNKIYDFMGAGIPVIASDTDPMERLLKETNAGIAFRSGDCEALARVIMEVSAKNAEYGKNGFLAVRGKYNWAEDEKRMIETIRILTNWR